MKWLSTTMVAAAATALLVLTPAAGWGKEHRVEIVDVKYKPAKIKVKKGDKVIWTNADDRDHTVMARDDKKKPAFNSGKIAAGEKFEFTFEKAGKFEYGCDYHPRMKGVVEVAE
jgi:plastocyanin